MVFVGIFFGWILGLVSPFLIGCIQRKRNIQNFKKALLADALHLRYFSAGEVFTLKSKLGVLDRETITGMLPIYTEYDGPDASEYITECLKKLSKMNDREIGNLSDYPRKPELDESLKKRYMPILKSRSDMLYVLPIPLQQEIRNTEFKLDIRNQIIDEFHFFYRKTFDGSISPENHKRLQQNIDTIYASLISQSRLLADRITEMIQLLR